MDIKKYCGNIVVLFASTGRRFTATTLHMQYNCDNKYQCGGKLRLTKQTAQDNCSYGYWIRFLYTEAIGV